VMDLDSDVLSKTWSSLSPKIFIQNVSISTIGRSCDTRSGDSLESFPPRATWLQITTHQSTTGKDAIWPLGQLQLDREWVKRWREP
jgi:hypothetical protein